MPSAAERPLSHVAITGASSGLGAALAKAYAGAGRRLSLFGRDRDRLEAVAEACRAGGGAAHALVADVGDAATMNALLLSCDREQPIDLLIANAGIGGADSLAGAAGESLEIATRLVAINTIGVMNTLAPLLPVFVARRCGAIAIISSAAGLVGLPDSPAYCGSKAAVIRYGEGLRRLLEPSGVSVSVICPGFIDTPMSASLPFRGPYQCSADEAAILTMKAIARRRPIYVFPWRIRLAVAVATLAPDRWLDRFLRIARRKAAL